LKTNTRDSSEKDFFFIREALVSDLGFASRLLADGFFSTSNIFSFQVEKFKTYLSLESSYPKGEENDRHKYFVACQHRTGKVIGFVEIDCRTNKNSKIPRPYMCNLAVDKTWARNGIGTRLVQECEELAIKCNETIMYLRVRAGNMGAIRMYHALGYVITSSETEGQDGKMVLLMKKQITSDRKNENTTNIIDLS